MQKKNMAFHMVIAISLLSLTVSVDESFAQSVDDQKLLEIVGDPASADTNYQVEVTGQIYPGPNANADDVINAPVRTTVNGFVYTTGADDFFFTGDIVDITADSHIFSLVDGLAVPNNSPDVAAPAITKQLVINGDAANTSYQVVVTGEIMPGPNANPWDNISSDKTTVNGEVWVGGTDDFFYTGELVSITSTHEVIATVDGVDALDMLYQELVINGDTANTTYKVVVTGDVTPGPDANPWDKIYTDGTTSTINGEVWATGTDSFYFSGSIVSIESDSNVLAFIDGTPY